MLTVYVNTDAPSKQTFRLPTAVNLHNTAIYSAVNLHHKLPISQTKGIREVNGKYLNRSQGPARVQNTPARVQGSKYPSTPARVLNTPARVQNTPRILPLGFLSNLCLDTCSFNASFNASSWPKRKYDTTFKIDRHNNSSQAKSAHDQYTYSEGPITGKSKITGMSNQPSSHTALIVRSGGSINIKVCTGTRLFQD